MKFGESLSDVARLDYGWAQLWDAVNLFCTTIPALNFLRDRGEKRWARRRDRTLGEFAG